MEFLRLSLLICFAALLHSCIGDPDVCRCAEIDKQIMKEILSEVDKVNQSNDSIDIIISTEDAKKIENIHLNLRRKHKVILEKCKKLIKGKAKEEYEKCEATIEKNKL